MTTADLEWACPECGLVRSLAAWRAAVDHDFNTLTCAMVPGLDGCGDGCGLLVCTWADGRRVWSAEAEDLAELLVGDRMNRARAELTAAEAECDASDALALRGR